jgi:hypothetical protein
VIGFSLSHLSHDGGNGSRFSYENQEPNPLIPNPKLAQRKLFEDQISFYGENDFATNGNDGMVMFQHTLEYRY